MCQVIHSSVGYAIMRFRFIAPAHNSIRMWYPTVQFTFRYYNPNTGENVWRSTNVQNFVCPAPGLDKRSSKSDQFTVTFKSKPGTDTPEFYTIFANASDDVQVSLDISRSPDTPGWKIGKGPKSGASYYGPDESYPEGHVYHSFWPRTFAKGIIIIKGKAIEANVQAASMHAAELSFCWQSR